VVALQPLYKCCLGDSNGMPGMCNFTFTTIHKSLILGTDLTSNNTEKACWRVAQQ